MNNETINVQERTKGTWIYKPISFTNFIADKYGLFEKEDCGFYATPICTINASIEPEKALANAAFILEACNNYDKFKESNAVLLENLKRIIDRIEENNLQGQFPSAYQRAKESIKANEQQ